MNRVGSNFKRKGLVAGVATALSLYAGSVFADKNTVFDVEISDQSLEETIAVLAEKSSVQIILSKEVKDNISLKALKGSYTLSAALAEVLSGTGLTYKFNSEDLLIVQPESTEERSEGEKEEVDEEIVVTGSRIARTPSQMAANVIVLNGDELRASGESTLEGALRRLPQNMFGASPVGATVKGSAGLNGAINIAGASTINLRGLGSESTLILIDGKRIGKSGVFGGVSDITGIPFSAIERVEILLDGASSIYGSDAVGGVVNVIMKKGYQELEIAHEYGAPVDGGFEEHVFSVNGGISWDGGQLRTTYEHFQGSNLDGEERPESVAWSRFHSPGQIQGLLVYTYQGESYFPAEMISRLGLPADSGIFAPFSEPGVGFEYGDTFLPEGQDGTNLSVDDFPSIEPYFGVDTPFRINSDASEGVSLIPAQQRDSLRVGFDQALDLWGNEVILSGTVYYSKRQAYAANGGFTFLAFPEAGDPLNPFGYGGGGLAVNWYIPSLPAKHYETDERVARWNLALDGTIGENWSWAVAAGQSRSKLDSNFFNEQIYNHSEAGAPPEEERETYLQLLDEGLNLYASDIVAANSPEILARLVKPESPISSINEENTLNINARGVLFSLPGGDVHLAVGADWRQERLETESSRPIIAGSAFSNSVGSVTLSSLPSDAFSMQINSKTQRSGYAELLLPVIGADNAMTGIEQLVLTGSVRYDSYHENGSSSTRSLGLIWNPIDQVKVRINQSTSFVTPSFRDRLRLTEFENRVTDSRPNGQAIPVRDDNGQVIGVDYVGTYIRGGNPDLKPERGESLSVGLQFTPNVLPGLTAQVTWHETAYKDRIGNPVTNIRDLGSVDYVALYPSISRDERGLLVIDQRSINIALVETAGVDYYLRYARDTRFGQFHASMNVGYTSKHNHIQFPGDDPVTQLANISINSRRVIPATRYITNLGWHHRGLSVNLTADTSSKTVSARSSSQRTVTPALNANISMMYDFERGDLFTTPSWLQDMMVKLAVLNVLDDHTETTFIDLRTGEPSIYSELNANVVDPRGRMFKLSVTKRF